MSIHRSLRHSGAMKRNRSVLSRVERLEALKAAAKWREGDSVFGLPKVRTVFKVKAAKKKKEEE